MIVKTTWANVRDKAISNACHLRYVDTGSNQYFIYVNDGNITPYCIINKTTPAGAEQTEFEGSYQSAANKPRIHDFDITPIHKGFTTTSAVTNSAIWTPASGKKIVVTDYQVSVHNDTLSTQATVRLFDETNSTANYLFSDQNTAGTQFNSHFTLRTPFVTSAINNSIRVTINQAIRFSCVLFGYEI